MSGQEFFRRLDGIRRMHDWTWTETAKAVGLSRTMVHFIKNGKHKVTRKVQERLELAERAGDQPRTQLVERLRHAGKLFKSLGLDVYTNSELWRAFIHFENARKESPDEARPVYEYVLDQLLDEMQKRGGEADFQMIRDPQAKGEKAK